MVPFLDLKRQYETIKDEVNQAVLRVFEHQSFILGQEVRDLEETVSQTYGTGNAIGVSSGTDALLISLMALEIGEGDEVITSPFTFFATAGVIHRLGAIPVFADIDPKTGNLDPVAVEKAFSERTACIIPVHIFGLMAEMVPILKAAERRGIPVVEDAAQAIGAWQEVEDQPAYAGTWGTVGCYSFFPSKNLGGAGDGGMVVTQNPDLAERIRRLRVHGSHPKYYHHMVGINGRLDEVQAAVLNVKFSYLGAWTERRRDNARHYRDLYHRYGLEEFGVSFLHEPNGSYHVYNQFTGRFPRRDALLAYLRERGVGAAIYYPLPLHLQPCFAHLGYRKGDLPEAEKAAEEVLSLPIFPELKEEELETVVSEIRRFYERGA